jgi:NADPH:quinone reductase-like Zn-dependent oxidoreductase
MEAYCIERFGSVDGIVLRSSTDPQPGTKEILMRVRASSLNHRDLMVLKGGGRGPTITPSLNRKSCEWAC